MCQSQAALSLGESFWGQNFSCHRSLPRGLRAVHVLIVMSGRPFSISAERRKQQSMVDRSLRLDETSGRELADSSEGAFCGFRQNADWFATVLANRSGNREWA